MKANLKSTRIAPKKANLIAKMIRGKSVSEALEILEKTNKKAARMLEQLLKSAMANAKNNENQNPDGLVIKSLVVNQAQAYHRGIPMARGRVRSIRKFLSHISLTLGLADQDEKKEKDSSQKVKTNVKRGSSNSKTDTEKGSSAPRQSSSRLSSRQAGQAKKTISSPKVSAKSKKSSDSSDSSASSK